MCNLLILSWNDAELVKNALDLVDHGVYILVEK